MKCKTCLEKHCEDCGKPLDMFNKDDYWKVEVDGFKSTQDIYNECEKLFPCYIPMDFSDIKDDRTGSYTVYFKKNVEADEEFKNMSANDLKEKGIKGITLKERLLLEIEYFKETGKHLDINCVTLCAGSRGVVSRVPIVGRDGVDGLGVYWSGTDDAGGDLRTRQAVFNP